MNPQKSTDDDKDDDGDDDGELDGMKVFRLYKLLYSPDLPRVTDRYNALRCRAVVGEEGRERESGREREGGGGGGGGGFVCVVRMLRQAARSGDGTKGDKGRR